MQPAAGLEYSRIKSPQSAGMLGFTVKDSAAFIINRLVYAKVHPILTQIYNDCTVTGVSAFSPRTSDFFCAARLFVQYKCSNSDPARLAAQKCLRLPRFNTRGLLMQRCQAQFGSDQCARVLHKTTCVQHLWERSAH